MSSPHQLLKQAVALHRQGQTSKATNLYQQVLKVAPKNADALHLSGMLRLQLGDLDGAVYLIKTAIRVSPKQALYYNNLGNALWRKGAASEALESYRQALRLEPTNANAYNNTANILKHIGDIKSAVAYYRQAINLDRKNLLFWQNLSSLMEDITQIDEYPGLREELADCFSITGVEHQKLAWVALNHWCATEGVSTLVENSCGNNQEFFSVLKLFSQVLNDPLLIGALRKTITTHTAAEVILTRVRESLLYQLVHNLEASHNIPELLLFIESLAIQCFNNEYAWQQTEREGEWLEILIANIKDNRIPENLLVAAVAILASYKALYDCIVDSRLAETLALFDFSEIKSLIRQQIDEPQDERDILGSYLVGNDAPRKSTSAVRNQYEENPFPRWVNIAYNEPKPLGQVLARLFPNQGIVLPNWNGSLQVLVAGCGTGMHPIMCAYRYLNAEITALDFSRPSLAYAIRKTRELNIENIKYKFSNILDLDEPAEYYNLIESVGVLHHLESPQLGLDSLADKLKPGGFIKLGLYSARARRVISRFRRESRCRYDVSPEEMRRCRRELLALPKSHYLKGITEFRDFYSLSGVRDLLFNDIEHCFTCNQLAALIANSGLEFIGFEFEDDRHTKRYKEHFPQDQAVNSLECWDEFEKQNPHTFRQMYIFWLRKRAGPL